MVKPHCSNFRIITAILQVSEFCRFSRKFSPNWITVSQVCIEEIPQNDSSGTDKVSIW